MMATQAPTTQTTDGTSMGGGSSTDSTPDDKITGGMPSPLFQSALSLTILLVTLVAVLLS